MAADPCVYSYADEDLVPEEPRHESAETGTSDDWLLPLKSTLKDLGHLAVDWDSYGGQPLSPIAASLALHFVSFIGPDRLLPDVYPLPNAGVQLEWSGKHDISVEILPTERVSFFVEERGGACIADVVEMPYYEFLDEYFFVLLDWLPLSEQAE